MIQEQKGGELDDVYEVNEIQTEAQNELQSEIQVLSQKDCLISLEDPLEPTQMSEIDFNKVCTFFF